MYIRFSGQASDTVRPYRLNDCFVTGKVCLARRCIVRTACYFYVYAAYVPSIDRTKVKSRWWELARELLKGEDVEADG